MIASRSWLFLVLGARRPGWAYQALPHHVIPGCCAPPRAVVLLVTVLFDSARDHEALSRCFRCANGPLHACGVLRVKRGLCPSARGPLDRDCAAHIQVRNET